MFGRETTLAKRNPAVWARISAAPKGQIITAGCLCIWTTVDPAAAYPDEFRIAEPWKLVTQVSAAEIGRLRWREWRPLIAFSLISLALLAVGAFYYRKLLLEKERTDSELALVAAQRETEEQLRLALDAARMGAYHWNVATGEIVWSDTFWSDTYRAIFGIPPDCPASYDNWADGRGGHRHHRTQDGRAGAPRTQYQPGTEG